MPAYDGDSFDFWGSGNWYDSSRIRAFTPLKRDGDIFNFWGDGNWNDASRVKAFTPIRRDGDVFLSGGGIPTPTLTPYFRMQGRDLGASVWRQWTVPNAPDLSASYYTGPPVSSWGDIFVLATWDAL